jgi:hypothetical protein
LSTYYNNYAINNITSLGDVDNDGVSDIAFNYIANNPATHPNELRIAFLNANGTTKDMKIIAT